MATVSGNPPFALAAAVLFISTLSGCNAVMPVRQSVIDLGSDRASVVTDGQEEVIAAADAPLPRQDYSAAGVKLPYVPQLNPYTAEDAIAPAEARSIYTAAGYLYKRGDLEGASAKYVTLTERFPSLSGPWVKLGDIAEKQSNHTEAISHYEKAVSVNKSNVNAWIALGLAQRKQGQFAAAQQAYLGALKLWKDFPEAHLNLAILYDLYLNKPEAAQKHYEAYCFLVGEKDENARKWLAEVKHRTGIEGSFIDNPPPKAATATASGTDAAVAIASSSKAEQN